VTATGWREVADRVFQRRYNPLDVSVCAVPGAGGLLLVDTRSSPHQADEIRADLRELGDQPVRCVVNTHAHFDHSFGNQRFAELPIYGHARVPAHLEAYERPMLADRIARGEQPVDEWREVAITPPTELIGDRYLLDLGDRGVELVHLGRGHTDNDLMLHIPDASAWIAGDLVEESGPPMYGPDCYPLEWPGTLAALGAQLHPSDVIVPGHGDPVSPDFVAAQQEQLAGVADLIRELHGAGVPAGSALDAGAGRWLLPADGLQPAITEAYRHLDRGTGLSSRPPGGLDDAADGGAAS
jgi:glyoxylase-like metal-dependent hydrolase (beta-lactamase superfamily II)